ncbi:effector-associated constant component EACC1 [Streptomyces sp. enrichment culture]|uniref:effector-associated constant component EACC1 n=1 Tax=Streptomyces sp. enrichment culture TaxID=1795815 RepID=UPI003F543CDA
MTTTPEERTGFRISIVDQDPLRARKEARELLAQIADADPEAALDVPRPDTGVPADGSLKGGLTADTIGVLISAGSLVAAGVQIFQRSRKNHGPHQGMGRQHTLRAATGTLPEAVRSRPHRRGEPVLHPVGTATPVPGPPDTDHRGSDAAGAHPPACHRSRNSRRGAVAG